MLLRCSETELRVIVFRAINKIIKIQTLILSPPYPTLREIMPESLWFVRLYVIFVNYSIEGSIESWF